MANKKAISDEEIISALLQHSTISEAAAAVGLSTRAIYDRMDSREFRSIYLWAKQDIIRSAVFSVNAKLSDAVDTIAEIMADPGNNPAIRLQAAKMILENHRAQECDAMLMPFKDIIRLIPAEDE